MKIGIIVCVIAMVGIIGGALYLYPNMSGIIAFSEKDMPAIPYLENLPEKPDNYDMVKRELMSGYLDISQLGPEYWLHPDFYPGWDSARPFYTKHDYSRWGVYGHGGFPSNPIVKFKTDKVGEWIRFSVLYKAGFNIETWQGVKLIAEENEYFDIELEPNEFLLPPTFPIFSKDWVKQLSIKTTIKRQPPKGTYAINIHSIPPSEEQSKEWFWQVLQTESLPEEEEMIMRAKMQADEKGQTPEKFQRWVEIGRKNKYVDGSIFEMGARITMEVVIE